MTAPYITSITIGNNVKTVGDVTFYWYFYISDIVLPEGLEYIGSLAFAHGMMKNITIPKSVKFIGYYAFEDCSSLNGVVFKNTSAWKISIDFNNPTYSIKSISVTNSSQNATFFEDTYVAYQWQAS